MINKKDILDYEWACGRESAYNLLILVGPDGFDGDYDEYKELEARLQADTSEQ